MSDCCCDPTESGGGATTFLGLTDTPGSYAGAAGQLVVVNVGETALEFSAGVPAMIYTVGPAYSGATYATLQAAVDQAVIDGHPMVRFDVYPTFYGAPVVIPNTLPRWHIKGCGSHLGTFFSTITIDQTLAGLSPLWSMENVGCNALTITGAGNQAYIRNCGFFDTTTFNHTSGTIRCFDSRFIDTPAPIQSTVGAAFVELHDCEISSGASANLAVNGGTQSWRLENCQNIFGRIIVGGANFTLRHCTQYSAGAGAVVDGSTSISEVYHNAFHQNGAATANFYQKTGASQLTEGGNSFDDQCIAPYFSVTGGTHNQGALPAREFYAQSTSGTSAPGLYTRNLAGSFRGGLFFDESTGHFVLGGALQSVYVQSAAEWRLPQSVPAANGALMMAGASVTTETLFEASIRWNRSGLYAAGEEGLSIVGNGGNTSSFDLLANGVRRFYMRNDTTNNVGELVHVTNPIEFVQTAPGTRWQIPQNAGSTGDVLTKGAGNTSTWQAPSSPVAYQIYPRTFTTSWTSTNTIYLMRFVAPATQGFDRVGLFIASASGTDTIRFGIYDAALTTLLAQGSFTPSTQGWVVNSMGATASLTGGTEYWLAVKGTNGAASIGGQTTGLADANNLRSIFDGGATLPASVAGATAASNWAGAFLRAA